MEEMFCVSAGAPASAGAEARAKPGMPEAKAGGSEAGLVVERAEEFKMPIEG